MGHFRHVWKFIRCLVQRVCGSAKSAGGSGAILIDLVDGNAAQLFTQPDIDGALVGGASLKADAFTVIVKAAAEAKRA